MDAIYLDTKQAAARLAEIGLPISPKTLNKLRCVGGGPEFRHFGRRPIYTEDGLRRWVAEKLSPPKRSTSEAA